jgi:hypothetical protein
VCCGGEFDTGEYALRTPGNVGIDGKRQENVYEADTITLRRGQGSVIGHRQREREIRGQRRNRERRLVNGSVVGLFSGSVVHGRRSF